MPYNCIRFASCCRHCTKNEVSIKDFFSKCDQICSCLKSLIENFIFYAVRAVCIELNNQIDSSFCSFLEIWFQYLCFLFLNCNYSAYRNLTKLVEVLKNWKIFSSKNWNDLKTTTISHIFKMHDLNFKPTSYESQYWTVQVCTNLT